VRFRQARDPWGVAADPALGDLDGDGEDDVVVATATGTWAYHLDGTSLPGWPIAGNHPVLGTPVLGHVNGDASVDLLVRSGPGFLTLDPGGQGVADFPPYPSVADFPMFTARGVTQSRIVLGTVADSTFFEFDLAAGLDSVRAWPMARGNSARTGSRFHSPALVAGDVIPPMPVADLGARALGSGSSVLTWTSPTDEAPRGWAVEYDLRYASRPISDANFAAAQSLLAGPPGPGGQMESLVVADVPDSGATFFCLRSRDASGNWSLVSNSAERLGTPPLGNVPGPAMVVARNPSIGSVTFYWQLAQPVAAGDAAIRIYDLGGRSVGKVRLDSGKVRIARWDGRDLNGSRAPAGLYFAVLDARGIVARTRFTLLP